MIKKIVSGGLGGVEQAALELAVKLEIHYQGWTLEKTAADLNNSYRLMVDISGNETTCIEKNIREAHGTLILYNNAMSGLLQKLRKTVLKNNKICLALDLGRASKFECALNINRWINENKMESLYITGARIRKKERLYQNVMDIIESAFYLSQVELSRPFSADLSQQAGSFPGTVEESVQHLEAKLPLKDKVMIANISYGELVDLNLTIGKYIRDNFGIWSGNTSLINSCRNRSGKNNLQKEDISTVIIKALWEKLKTTHRLRVVK